MDINHNFLAVGIVGFVAVIGLLMFGLGISTSDNDVTGAAMIDFNRANLLRGGCVFTERCGGVDYNNVWILPYDTSVGFGASLIEYNSLNNPSFRIMNIVRAEEGNKVIELEAGDGFNLKPCLFRNVEIRTDDSIERHSSMVIQMRLLGFSPDHKNAYVEVRE